MADSSGSVAVMCKGISCFECPHEDCIRDGVPNSREEYNKAYYAAHKEKLKDYHKAYGAANRERILAYKKAYYAANKERIRAYNAENKEKRRAYYKVYRGEHRKGPSNGEI